jgi:hypothetical protein
MKQTLTLLCFAAVTVCVIAADSKAPSTDSAPKWLFLGEDADLLRTLNECDEAVLGCVYRVEFVNIRASLATVNLHMTVARNFKGRLSPDERITIDFPIDDLPLDGAQREKRLADIRAKDIGRLRFGFLWRTAGANARYSSEWLYVPRFTSAMNDFLEAHRTPQLK